MRVTEVLQGIEKCIKAFWMYVKTDQKKPWWKMSKFMWTYPPVEDPRDLELLANLTKTLRKKEIWLKRLAREEEVLVEKRSKPSGSISREGNFVYNDRDEAGIKGAQNVDDFHFSTQMVPGEA
ncbi:hypothetical protein RHGRI_034340 [Rhododendron griersonianum]|uniref:Uncharacterized protein n=1 Tax=Rhododendron griersonianum TaxID=479676 RepID=A0AAV6I323_9ERIC|nr:hypothetical protein RHGRI_034340 [Rhododendron griersonianum]